MIVEKHREEGYILLKVKGVIRLGESAEFFAKTLDKALHEGDGDVLVDFSEINYIDSTGIGELVGYLGRFRDRGRQLILINPSPRIEKLLEVAQLLDLFPIFPSVTAATES